MKERFTNSEKRAAVQKQLGKKSARFSVRDIEWLDDADKPLVEELAAHFQKTAMKSIGSDVQKALIGIVAKKGKGRPPGGARGLLMFTSWLFLKGQKHWELSSASELKLAIAAQFVRWDGAKILGGHDTVAPPEDMKLALKEIIPELAHWFSTKYAISLLNSYQKSQKTVLDRFVNVVNEKAPKPWNRKQAAILLTKCLLVRMNGPGSGIIALGYGAAAPGLFNHVLFRA